MLRLRHDAPRGFDLASSRNYYQRRIRERELNLMFQTVRNSLLETYLTHSYQPPSPPPISHPQLPPNYLQYLSYLLRAPPLPLTPPPPNPPRLLPPAPSTGALVVSVQNQQGNVYFHKKGIVVLRSLLGRGSFSKVWEGRVVASGERVAVKEVKKLQPGEEQCLRELRSEHIIKVIDIFTHASRSFIVLEFCGCNLRQQLTSCGFELSAALNYFEQLVAGMQALQSHAVVHRDLKFENILVRSGSLKIADFGLAKFLGDELEVESRRCGTPYTMAPEVFFAMGRTGYSAKSDIWAVGVLLHEMLYQQHPFACSTRQLQQRQRVKITQKFGVLDRIIDRCLVFDPELRADWDEFMQLFHTYKQAKDIHKTGMFEKQEAEPIRIVEEKRNFKRKEHYYAEEDHQKVQIIQRKMQRKQRKEELTKDIPILLRTPRNIKYESIAKNKQPRLHKRQQAVDNSKPVKPAEKEDEVIKYLNPPHIQHGRNRFRPLHIQRKGTLERPEKPLPKIAHAVIFIIVFLMVALMAYF